MPSPLQATEEPETLRRVRHLVSLSEGDPLAPFALRPDKSYAFAPDGSAAVDYRVRVGTAVASGDPVGVQGGWAAAIAQFVCEARTRRLRIAVLGAGERAHELWRRHSLSGLAYGRDVVVRHAEFTVHGRLFRNVRQAIKRSHSALLLEFGS